MLTKLNNKGFGGLEFVGIAVVYFATVAGGMIGLAEMTDKKSIRELAGDPCENSEYALTGSGSYVCQQ